MSQFQTPSILIPIPDKWATRRVTTFFVITLKLFLGASKLKNCEHPRNPPKGEPQVPSPKASATCSALWCHFRIQSSSWARISFQFPVPSSQFPFTFYFWHKLSWSCCSGLYFWLFSGSFICNSNCQQSSLNWNRSKKYSWLPQFGP